MKMIILASILVLGLAAYSNEEPKSLSENNTIENHVSKNPEFKGVWSGKISGSPLEMIITLSEKSGALSVPAQSITNLQAESISYNNDSFTMKINFEGQNIEISGVLKDGVIEGLFSQNGIEAPITFATHEEDIAVNETYERINIDVEGGALIAALELPPKTPSAVAIIVAGSGGTDKNGNSVGMESNSYKMLAESLAAEGIATIRYDKRGIGENRGLVKDLNQITIDLFASDVENIVKYALQDERFSDVHIIGHSEGALLATLAAQKQKVDSIILLAGVGRSMDEVLIEQLSAQLPANLLEESKNILTSLKAGKIVESVSKELQPVFSIPNQPYLISWIKYNPVDELEKVNTKKYVVQGNTDIQVAETDWAELSKVATEAIMIEGMNHILKESPAERAANIATYNEPNLLLHKDIAPTISRIIGN